MRAQKRTTTGPDGVLVWKESSRPSAGFASANGGIGTAMAHPLKKGFGRK